MTTALLAVFAHPDDESLHAGALIARTAATGNAAVIVTLTRGGAGRTLGMCAQTDLPALRAAELRAAANALGAAHIEVHDLPDGRLATHEPEAVRLVRAALRRWQPDRVVTFPPNGFNGHPDHCAVHRVVGRAVDAEAPQIDLWWTTCPVPYREPTRPGFLAPRDVELGRLPVTEMVPVGPHLLAKARALGCHETQARSTAKLLRCYPELLIAESFHRPRC